MNILLDTHIALWAIAYSPKLPRVARALIADEANTITVSAASVWEIAIKFALARGDMPISGKQAHGYFLKAGYALLPINPAHTLALETLPPIHGDPFDRILIAQAITEPMRFVTHDALLARYSDAVMLC